MIISRNFFETRSLIFITILLLSFLKFPSLENRCFSKDNLAGSIKLSADYIVNSTDSDGKFDYLVDPEKNKVNQKKYNILRHSGTIYSLGQYYGVYNDERALDAMLRAGDYLKNCCISSVSGRKDMLAVWSLPKINKSVRFKKAKLGGTGLGLVALVSLEKIKPGTTDISYLRKLGNFILFMQKTDGSFYSRFTPFTGGRDDSWTSLYYPGEAALGLAMLYEIDPQPKWFDSSVKTLTYLADSRRGSKVIPADHWALIATSKIIEIADKESLKVPRDKLIVHGIQVSEKILDGVPDLPESSPIFGCLKADGRTTPTSTRLEGLIAFYGIVPENNNELKKKIESVSTNGIGFLQRVQIKSGKYKGGIPKRLNNNIHEDSGLIRIDYVQHALSALVEYHNTFGK